MPKAVRSKGFSPAEHAIRVRVSGDMCNCGSIGEEESRRRHILRHGNNHVATQTHRMGEELIRIGIAAICELDRGMIRAALLKDDIQGDSFRSLLSQFVREARIDLSRPIKPE